MKDQFDMFSHRPAHAKGSDTSREAAESLVPAISGMTKSVYAFIKASEETPIRKAGATCDEVEVGLMMRHQTASSRIWALRKKGFIRDSGERRLTRSGRKAAVWVICPCN